MRNAAIVTCVGLMVAAVITSYVLSRPSPVESTEEAASSVESLPRDSVASATAPVKRELPAVEPPAPVAAQAPKVEPKEASNQDALREWANVPVEQPGATFRGDTTAFNRTLGAGLRTDLKDCNSNLKDVLRVNMELYAELTPDGVTIRHARVGPESNADVYTTRCLEAGFERQVRFENKAAPAGSRLVRLNYPVVMYPRQDPDGGE